ncbi:MAG: hypothetical protein ACI86M_003126 [Saprospiraceae bacterium]
MALDILEGKISMKFNGTEVLVRNEAKKVFRFQVSGGFRRKHTSQFLLLFFLDYSHICDWALSIKMPQLEKSKPVWQDNT